MAAGGQSQEEIVISAAEWSADTEAWLVFSLQDATLTDLHYQVQNGAKLFHVFSGGRHVGAFILRIDSSDELIEGVVVAAAARLPGHDLTLGLLPHIEKMFQGVDRVRIHTARPGMAKKLEKIGYEAKELVLAKVVGNGR